jgi:hypothetical protein
MAVENLSEGGAFIRTHEPLLAGSPVLVDLVRPGLKKSVSFTGRVVSSVSPDESRKRGTLPGMSIAFDPYPAEVRERYRQLLESLTSQEATEPTRKVPVQSAPPPRAVPPPLPIPAQGVTVPDSAKLMVQVKGLLMELGNWQSRAGVLERENAELREELAKLKGDPAKARSR